MASLTFIQIGMLLVLFGGFILVDADSTLFGLEFYIMLAGLGTGLVGAVPNE